MNNELNLYNLVSGAISLITPKREVIINKTRYIVNDTGDYVPYNETFKIADAIVQPFSPTNIAQFGEHSLDSAHCFKVYFQTKEPFLLTSSEPTESGFSVCFQDPIGSGIMYTHNVFAVQNYTMNGWIRMDVARINLETDYDLDET